MSDRTVHRFTRRTRVIGRRLLGLDVPEPPHTVAALHSDEPDTAGLTASDTTRLHRVRFLGATGSVLMAIGALGAGAQPVLQNPTQGVRVLGLFARMPTTSLAMCLTGAAMVVIAWLMLGCHAIGDVYSIRPPRRMSRSQLDRTLLLWVLPLTVAPPMFSRDVYSYLAQSQITAMGLDPYRMGPGPALGVAHLLTRTVPNIWRETPAPYGPLFLWMGSGISALTGNNIVVGIFVHRLLALGGLVLIVWALPRLARRCGVAEVGALWLGAANPLVLFHLVSGVHNEALMLGLMLSGIELTLVAVDGVAPLRASQSTTMLLGGCVLIALASTIKLPGLAAMPFVAAALARRIDDDHPGHRYHGIVIAATVTVSITATVTLVTSLASGLGFGWLHTLDTAGAVRSWMSLTTSLGVITGFLGVLLGVGDHTTAAIGLARPLGELTAAFVTLRMLVAAYTGRLPAVGALGVSLGAVVLLSPVVQPWYLLWAVLPLAAWATRPLFRLPTIVISAAVCVIQMPSGADYVPFTIVEAALATIVTIAAVVALTRHLLPWRVWALLRVVEPTGRR